MKTHHALALFLGALSSCTTLAVRAEPPELTPSDSVFWGNATVSNPELRAGEVPPGFGQLENVPKIVDGGLDSEGREYAYFGQRAGNQKLVLTASNGFFTKRTCAAKGESRLPKAGDDQLIVPNFEYLAWKQAEGSLRWHILVRNPGQVHFNVHMDVSQAGTGVEVAFAGQTKRVRTSRASSDRPQAWNLHFEVEEPGEYSFSLRAIELGNNGGVGHLYRVDAFGPAMDGADLLRVRWRPAAVHGGFDTKRVRDTKLLVFTTRSMTSASNYSPITTPFGYYGTTFGDDRRSGGGFNFSMWGGKGASADLKRMPHLLGVGSSDGEFSGFGHEGSGVKPRGWMPMPDRPELVVQALRLVSGEEYDSYYGYYFDHQSMEWRFFGAGNKWHGGKPNKHLKLGSFCEVPGPPQSERTGDIYREVRRKLWAYDEGNWMPLEVYRAGGRGSSGDDPVNKSWFTSGEGEYAMGCGGVRLYRHKESLITEGGHDGELPDFLTSPTIERIFRMPIQYGEIQATEVAARRTIIEVDILAGGDLNGGTVYYGIADALTFAPRKLHGTERNSELSQTVNRKAWQAKVEIPLAGMGVNRITLKDLEPGTKYFYRVLMNNAESRIWNDKTLSFTTPMD